MREVPRLTLEAEERLIAVYHGIVELTNRVHVIRMLAFGGGDRAAELLRWAVTEESSGRSLGDESRSVLLYIPVLCGVLAQRSDEALAFLRAGAMSEYWSGRTLWRHVAGQEQWRGAVQGACIKGLALSGRDEQGGVLEWYREHPEAVVVVGPEGESTGTVGGAVVEAAFCARLVREMGVEAAMDQVIQYPRERFIPSFIQWRDTPEGEAWHSWFDLAEAAAQGP